MPTRWEDTAMRQEFDLVRNRFDRWAAEHNPAVSDDDDVSVAIKEATAALDRLGDVMSGRL